MSTRFTGEAHPGCLVELARDSSEWWTLAYTTPLKGRGAELTREHFDEIVANFRRVGRSVPVVLYHADTDATAHPESRKAHAWLDDLRVGSMTLDGKRVATLEGKRRWVNDATRKDVASGALVCGSITVFFDCVDDVTGLPVGTLLYSFSLTNNPALTDLPALAASAVDLTNNPALVDLPRIAASRSIAAGAWYGDLDDRDDVLEMLRCVFGLPALADEAAVSTELAKLAALLAAPDESNGIDADDILGAMRSAMRLPALTSATDVIAAIRAALATPPMAAGEMPASPNDSADSRSMSRGSRAAKETRMSTTTMMALAARLGFAAPTEEAAAQHVAARAEESAEVRRSLGLALTTDVSDVKAKITALHSDAAKAAVLSAENEALKADVDAARDVAVKEHIEALCVDPAMAKSRTALEAFARSNFAAFSKDFPKPTVNAATLALTARVTSLGGDKTPEIVAGRASVRHNDAARERAAELMAATPALTLESALKQASRELRAGKGN